MNLINQEYLPKLGPTPENKREVFLLFFLSALVSCSSTAYLQWLIEKETMARTSSQMYFAGEDVHSRLDSLWESYILTIVRLSCC